MSGVVEAGWTPPEPSPVRLLVDGTEQPPTPEAVHSLGREVLDALRAHEDSPAFCVPVKAEEVPDYYDIIKVRSSEQEPPRFVPQYLW